MRHIHLNRSVRSLFALLVLAIGAGLCIPALAQSPSQVRFATVYKITGSVVASDADGKRKRELKQGDAVYVGEQVRSSSTGEAVLKTEDAGIIAIRPNAAFAMERFSANGDARDQFSLRIFSGALRVITGWTGLFTKANHRITTPSATVGIRGTDHEPYVLSPEMSVELNQPEGTYNKVNSGATVLAIGSAELDITPGKVGFAPVVKGTRTRALLTALTPALLDKVPGFFVPGAFDAELETLAANSMRDAVAQRKFAPAAQAETAGNVSATTTASAASSATAPLAPNLPAGRDDTSGCMVTSIATQWLAELDATLVARDANAFVSKFASDASITATVRGNGGAATQIRFTLDEMAKSTFTAMGQLSRFESRRPVIRATLGNGTTAASCDRIAVESIVIESGVRNGASYRLESLESFQLIKKDRNWIAVQAHTTQQ